MNLRNATDEQLNAEIARREAATLLKPIRLATINFDLLTEMCSDYLAALDQNGWADEDSKGYIFEAAMTAIYGQEVWPWIREKTN